MTVTAEQIREALRGVMDPELGINIVDLGLIYEIDVYDGGNVQILMTLTTVGCPMSSYLSSAASQAAEQLEGVDAVTVSLVWSPPWDPSMISDEGRKVLDGMR